MQLIQLNTQSVSMDVLNSDSAINTKNCKIHAEFVHRKYQKVVNGAVVSHWTCVNFSRGVQESAAQEFCQELASMCQVSGLVILFFAVLVDVMFLHFSQKRSKNMHRNINIKDNNMEKLFFIFMACKSCCSVISPSSSFFRTS